MISICGIIILYNPSDSILLNIETLSEQVDHIILVDNGSKKSVLKMVSNKCENNSKLSLIENSVNLGIATALNIGVRKAVELEYQWIATFDQDSCIGPNYFESMIEAYNFCLDRDKVRIMSPVYRDRHTDRLTSADGLLVKNISKTNHYYRNVEFCMTSGNLVNSDLFAEIGFFTDKLFIDQVDHDFCLRCVNDGYLIIESIKTVLNHSLGEQTAHKFLNRSPVATNHSPLRRYYMARNRIYMYRTYFISNTQWVITDIARFIKEIFIIILFEKDRYNKIKMTYKGIVDSLLKKYGKYEINRRDGSI